uniref:NADH dehydrogenase subunit 6 n=1 Tax=Amblythyreus gestroi TaxID=2126070 RepID=A0A343W8N4_9HEMI|nr:NADH dehydrogenase subunit 6 [Amblythyreus gestroi]AVZ00724.1 NADH dehydrogenase subunit 6 [Amblythyreus gestroi]
MMTMLLLSMTLSLMFIFMKHPLSMGLMLILQTITISLTTGMMMNMFWYSYVLLMIMLSGALVLFMYMASIASNEKFSTPWMMIIMSTIMLLISLLINILVDQMSTSNIWSTKMDNYIMNEVTITMSNFFMNYNMMITLFLVSYLFLTMIAITYVVNVFEGPLRMKS